MDDRQRSESAWIQEGPRTRRQRTNLTIRWLGILLPLVFSSPIVYWIVTPVSTLLGLGAAGWPGSGVWLAMGAVIWIAAVGVLCVRRDWQGAGGISAVYVVINIYWWLPVLGVFHFD